MAYKDLKFENIRKVFSGHWLGAGIGAIIGYFAFKYYGDNFTFAVTPLQTALTYVKVNQQSIIITSIIVALGAFIGAFIQARGRY